MTGSYPLPWNLTSIIPAPRFLLPRHTNIEKLAVLLLTRYEDNALQLCNPNPNLKVRMLGPQIRPEPLSTTASVNQKNIFHPQKTHTPGETHRKVKPASACSIAYCAFSICNAALETL